MSATPKISCVLLAALIACLIACVPVEKGVYQSLGEYVTNVRGTPISISNQLKTIYEKRDYRITYESIHKDAGQMRAVTPEGTPVMATLTQLNQSYSRVALRVGGTVDLSGGVNPLAMDLIEALRHEIDPTMRRDIEVDYPENLPERFRR